MFVNSNNRTSLTALVQVALLLALAAPASAAIVFDGEIEPGDLDDWPLCDTAYIGKMDGHSGTVTVDDGSQLSNSRTYLGYQSESTGTAVIAGAGSKWTNEVYLCIGYEGRGTLLVREGAEVVSSGSCLGSEAGSNGTVTVHGPGSKWNDNGSATIGDSLYVGRYGNGVLTVEAGGEVESDRTYLGYWPGSSGIATIRGAGSTWNVNGVTLYVGYRGPGTLTVEDGAEVNSRSALVGSSFLSTWQATVRGSGSKWTNTGELRIGASGHGTLTVEDGGRITTETLYASLADLRGDGTITATKGACLDANLIFDAAHGTTATVPFGSGGTLTVTAEGGGDLCAGYYGTGRLEVTEGVVVKSDEGAVAFMPGSIGEARINGAGSKWLNNIYLTIGHGGTGTLLVEDGGEVCDYAGMVGHLRHSVGKAIVRGDGSRWSNSADLYLGNYHATGELHVEAGGEVNNEDGYIGRRSESVGAAKVCGDGSRWTNRQSLYVGYEGAGTLTVENGGEINSKHAHIGYSQDSRGSVVVRGAGSKWINEESLSVAVDGAATLVVKNGGEVITRTLGISVENPNRYQSLLAVDIGLGSQITVDNGTGNIENAGLVRFLAGPAPPAGSVHSPIAAGTWTGNGAYEPFGGTWDATNHVFTVSETCSGISGETVTLDLSERQRVLIEEETTGQVAGVSFLAVTGFSYSLNFSATALTPAEVVDLDELTQPQGLLLGGWNLSAPGSGYNYGAPAYVSFEVPSYLDPDEFTIWRLGATGWSNLAPFDLTCAGGYASFTSEGLGIFAIAVPEPSMAFLLAIGILGILTRRASRGFPA